jgi:AcrR family transcriptional regulator
MPYPTFYKLDENKQNIILNQAKIEFSNYLFEDASINRIIKEINLSRGSFYLYFKNKEDLYFYMLDTIFEKNNKIFKEKSIKHNKDIKKIFVDLFEHALIQTDDNKKLIKNIFINFNTNHALKIIPIDKNKTFLKTDLFDFSKYNIEENDKHLIIHIIDTLLIQSISFAFKNIDDKDRIKSIFIKEINIILNGIERRNI